MFVMCQEPYTDISCSYLYFSTTPWGWDHLILHVPISQMRKHVERQSELPQGHTVVELGVGPRPIYLPSWGSYRAWEKAACSEVEAGQLLLSPRVTFLMWPHRQPWRPQSENSGLVIES